MLTSSPSLFKGASSGATNYIFPDDRGRKKLTGKGGSDETELLFGVDWRELFVPDKPLLQVAVRGTVIYVVIFSLVRASRTGRWAASG